MAYANELPEDAVGKKFVGVLSDNGSGANAMDGMAGARRRTQNGEVVSDLSAYISNQPINGGVDLSRFDVNTGHNDQVITVGSSHVHIGALDGDTTHVLLSLEDDEIRYRVDGTDPTDTVGHRMEPRNSWVWRKAYAVAASFIRGQNALQDATLHVTELIEAPVHVEVIT